MITQEQWNVFHKELGKPFNISPGKVQFIRSMVLNKKHTQQSLISWLLRKKRESGKKRKNSKEYYDNIKTTLLDLTEKQFSSLLIDYKE